MNNNPLYEHYTKIYEYCKKLRDASYDTYKLFSPASEKTISNWESENNVVLPEGLKNWYLLSNGYDMSSTADILPIEHIRKYCCDDLTELDEAFIVGHYIGDGSMLVIGKNDDFYEYDHAYNRLYKMEFQQFLEKWIIENLEDCMYEAGLM